MNPHKNWLDNEYREWADSLAASTPMNFKDHPAVIRMLGDFDWPREFQPALFPYNLELIRKIDSIGHEFGSALPREVSGPCWRMVYYARQILARDPKYIVEIGGGVGQFYAILRALGYAGEYYIFDLRQVKEFQYAYLQEVEYQTGLSLPQKFSNDFSSAFCVSFYALGEFDDETKEWYVENIIKKCPHGFILWNPHSGASDDISFPCTVQAEYPMTGPGNKQLEW